MSEQTHIVKIKKIKQLTHDVKSFTVEKPKNYTYDPGQATEVSINKHGWKEEKRPFTFTSIPEDDYLEFTIKSYHDHDGVTQEIDNLKEGDELIIGDSWGAISYNGPGYFIAGGAGVTPFISIFRKLDKEDNLENNYLIFSNKTEDDVILEKEWKSLLGPRFLSTLTDKKAKGHLNEFIDKEFLDENIKDFSKNFYVCGPDKMVKDISESLEELGAEPEGITFEQ